MLQRLHSAPNVVVDGDTQIVEKWIEDYLDQIYAPLVGAIPYRKRQEIRREIREHIDQLIIAHKELGSDVEEATLASLRQFGEPSGVASKWLDEMTSEERETPYDGASILSLWERKRNKTLSAMLPVIRYSVRIMAPAVLIWLLIGVGINNVIRSHSSLNEMLSCSLWSLGASIPLVGGYVTGRKHPNNGPVFSMLLAQAMVLPCWPFALKLIMQVTNSGGIHGEDCLVMGLLTFAVLSPTGCFGAWFGAKRRRIAHKRASV